MNEELIQRAVLLLQQEFGPNWQSISQTLGTENLRKRLGKELTSFMAFPDRGNGGDNQWRGNCSPQVVSSILRYVIDCKKYYGNDIVIRRVEKYEIRRVLYIIFQGIPVTQASCGIGI